MAARVSARFHPWISAHGRTVFGTRLTHHRACRTRVSVKRRLTDHEIGRGLTNVRAVEEQPEVVRLSMVSALVRTVIPRLQASAITVLAILDADQHRFAELAGL